MADEADLQEMVDDVFTDVDEAKIDIVARSMRAVNERIRALMTDKPELP